MKTWKENDTIGVDRPLDGVAKEFRRVVRRIGPTPLQFNEGESARRLTPDVGRRAPEAILPFPLGGGPSVR